MKITNTTRKNYEKTLECLIFSKKIRQYLTAKGFERMLFMGI